MVGDYADCQTKCFSLLNIKKQSGGTMKIISFIKDDATIKKIMKDCGKWIEAIPAQVPRAV